MKIAIASGKGGTGKTTLSTNLSVYLSEKMKVMLVDLDVEEPNSGLFVDAKKVFSEDKFKMTPEWNNENCTLCGKCQEVCNFNAVMKIADKILVFPELCHGCFACSELCHTNSLPMKPKKMGELTHYKNGNLDFVESRLIIGEEQAVPLIKQTLNYVETLPSSDVKIFDSPPGTSCAMIEATKKADLIILITEPTPFGLHDLKLATQTVQQLEKPFVVVINRYGIGDKNVEKYCKNENIPIIAKIENSREVAELYSAGKLIKTSNFIEQLEKISEYILLKKKEFGR